MGEENRGGRFGHREARSPQDVPEGSQRPRDRPGWGTAAGTPLYPLVGGLGRSASLLFPPSSLGNLQHPRSPLGLVRKPQPRGALYLGLLL